MSRDLVMQFERGTSEDVASPAAGVRAITKLYSVLKAKVNTRELQL